MPHCPAWIVIISLDEIVSRLLNWGLHIYSEAYRGILVGIVSLQVDVNLCCSWRCGQGRSYTADESNATREIVLYPTNKSPRVKSLHHSAKHALWLHMASIERVLCIHYKPRAESLNSLDFIVPFPSVAINIEPVEEQESSSCIRIAHLLALCFNSMKAVWHV